MPRLFWDRDAEMERLAGQHRQDAPAMDWLLTGKPYAVQRVAMARSSKASAGGFCYFLEMGLGKTALALNDFLTGVKSGEFNTMVVLCPFSLKQVWLDQIKTWLPDPDSVAVVVHPDMSELPKDKPSILIMNYESFSSGHRIGGARFGGMLKEAMDGFRDYKILVCLEECTQIKNHQATRTKIIHQQLDIGVKEGSVKRVIALSGNPMPNGPQEVWSALKATGGTSIGFYKFRHLFCQMGGYRDKQVVGIKKESVETFDFLINNISFVATKTDWTDLPPKVYQVRNGEMGAKQKEHYKAMNNEMITFIKNISGDPSPIEANMILVQMLKLRQISSGFVRDTENDRTIDLGVDPNDTEVVDLGEHPKMRLVEEILDEVHGKAILVGNHKFIIAKLIALCEKRGLQPAWIKGGMKPDELAEQKRLFNEDPDCRVIVCQSQSAKFGHTLLGGDDPKDHCSTVVFVENDFSFEARAQTEDRCHRWGQKGDQVVYIDLLVSDVDRDILHALRRKKKVFERVVERVRAMKDES